MKKIVYTFSLVALFSIMSKAQTSEPAKKQEPKKEAVNPDGTLKSASSDNAAKPADSKPATGTRMAITEKGVPASKSAKTETKPAKAEK